MTTKESTTTGGNAYDRIHASGLTDGDLCALMAAAIGLYREYRDVHGHTVEGAELAAMRDTLEGIHALGDDAPEVAR